MMSDSERKPLVQAFYAEVDPEDARREARAKQAASQPSRIPASVRICCGCSLITVTVLLLIVFLVLTWLLPATPGLLGSWLACKLGPCMKIFSSAREAECNACLDGLRVKALNSPVGAYGIPFGYFLMAAGQPPPNGTEEYGQTIKDDWETVNRLGSELPKKTWEGSWWRGNELGFIVYNPAFWSTSGIWPLGLAMGSTPRQHAAIRPFLEEAFTLNFALQSFIRDSARTFLEERATAGSLELPGDIQRWGHQVLYRAIFGEVPTWQEATAFCDQQSRHLTAGVLGQALPPALYPLLGVSAIAVDMGKYVEKYTALVDKKWGSKLRGLDCSPSPNCTVQLASGIFDALFAAGGLSVPGGIHTGLGVLYSTNAKNPGGSSFDISPGTEAQFFWESIRYFPPVYGVPFWEPRPTCSGLSAEETARLNRTGGETEACPRLANDGGTGIPPVNQWGGGKRTVLNLGAAQWDKRRWGEDAHEFVLRPLSEYTQNSVGFSEMAVDPKVANGLNDRSCPGKQLALAMGTLFFGVFKKSEWYAPQPDIFLDPIGALTQVGSFTLLPVKPTS